MASPFPFTSGQVLTAAQLNSIGEATAFTPSWTSLTVGNAVESWYYTQVNNLVIVQGITVLGSTSTVSGNISMDYPVGTPVVTSFMSAGHSLYRDAGTDTLLGICLLGTSDVALRFYEVSGTEIGFGNVNASSPFTWTDGDDIRLSFVYQIS